MEIFTSIKGYESRYKINKLGVIKSIPIRVNCRGGKTRLLKEKEISTFKTEHGYLAVDLTNGRVVKRQYLHRLIYSHFVSDIPKGMVINHIDGNTENNSIENLECVTQQDNVRHYVKQKKNNVGVSYDKHHRGKKWRAIISNKGKILLGYYKTKEDASAAIDEYINKNLQHLKYR